MYCFILLTLLISYNNLNNEKRPQNVAKTEKRVLRHLNYNGIVSKRHRILFNSGVKVGQNVS